MDRQTTLETLQGLNAIALTINELRERRHKADSYASPSEPFVKVALVYDEITVSVSRDRGDSIHMYSSKPGATADGSIDDAVTVMSEILEELSEYADD